MVGFVVQCGAISHYMSCKACKQSKQHSLTCSIISIRASQLGTVATSWFPKRHILLAVIKPYMSYMYVLFVYKVKLKGSTMQTE